MKCTELMSYTERDLKELNQLMTELSSSSCCSEQKLQAVIESKDSHLYVIRLEGRIIAAACLCVGHTTEFTLGFVEAVVVSSEFRGQNYGKQLMLHIIQEARVFHVESLHLTSNPRRVAANALYQRLGFIKYNTNVYKMNLSLVSTKPFKNIL